jgi:uncharacterized sulfatase
MQSAAEYARVRSRSFYLIRSAHTLPRFLATQGYRSLQTGKFWEGHYSNAGFDEGMTVFAPVPGQEFGGNRTLASGELVAHGNGDWGLKIGRETLQPIGDFLASLGEGQRFLLWYAPYLPHQPHDAPAEFVQRYRDSGGLPRHLIPYYANCSWFDHTVGNLLEILRKHETLDRSLVVFLNDNGWTPSENPQPNRPAEFAQTRTSKRSPFEDGLRTPILLSWPGVIPPGRHTALVSSIDVVPTILDAVGLQDKAAPLPGISLLPAARGARSLAENRPVFGEIYPGDCHKLGHPSEHIAYRWVRQGTWKLIVPHSQGKKTPWGKYLDRVALFNLAQDPGETRNRADDPEVAAQRKLLTELLDDWWTPGDDSSVPKPPPATPPKTEP